MEEPFRYLVFYYPALEVVPVSIFLAVGTQGEVRGLYFGDAGSGTFDEAYFRMDSLRDGKLRFLECENPEDLAFCRNRATARRTTIPLSPDDACVFEQLRTYRRAWWTFGDGDRVVMHAGRLKKMWTVDTSSNGAEHEALLLCARSDDLDAAIVERVRKHWSLRGL